MEAAQSNTWQSGYLSGHNSDRTTGIQLEDRSELTRENVTERCERAIAYLASRQLPNGAFQTEGCILHAHQNERNPTPTSLFEGSPCVTAMILYSLQFASVLSARTSGMTARGLSFLVSALRTGDRRRDDGGRIAQPAAPADLNEIACVAQLLEGYHLGFPPQKHLFRQCHDPAAGGLRNLTADKVSRRLAHSAPNDKPGGSTPSENSASQDVCAAVNANIILYLGHTGLARRASDYLLRLFRSGTERQAVVFYAQPLSLYYMASRALYCGVTALQPISVNISEGILREQRADGSFGDELHTAMAISSLLNLGEDYLHSRIYERAIQYLLSTQRQDGSWQRVPMYGDAGSPATFGSRELTTALCVEAFCRYNAA